MLKLMPTLNEKNKGLVADEVKYDILLNEERIGTFALYHQQKENHANLCGWADQYVDEPYWGEYDYLLRLVLSTEVVRNEARSFIFISNLTWMISDDELFARNDEGFCIADYFVLQLEALRVEYRANVCYIPSTNTSGHSSQWEAILKNLGFRPVSKTDLETFYVSSRHLCSGCGVAWPSIEEPFCLDCFISMSNQA